MGVDQLTTVIFILALVGFVFLTVNAVLAAKSGPSRWLSLATVVVALVELFLLWVLRNEMGFRRNEEIGFAVVAVFYVALVAILFASIAPKHSARGFALTSFFVVCLGANIIVWPYNGGAVVTISILIMTFPGAAIVLLYLFKKRKETLSES